MLTDNITSNRTRSINGITYAYNMTRMKWLSIGTCHISYGINHRSINTSRWLAVTHGIYSNNIGFKIPKDGTIITAIAQAKNQTTCKFIVKDENLIDVLELGFNNESDKIVELNVDFEEEVSLRCYLEIESDKIDFPFIVLECAYRL